ncbi:hypothetical protein [Pseudomonas rubra]|uniref:SMODS and SLOG-associating 2TM effector domain-containing protein n=1 Tax=Pseudomonas rubra TaxID=2942627 RepID=A0ABT5PE17_9PSED|nr:hypothetical protein [Pseudomonas rubra]MDD1016560.1 hypothetical protein [Pseudomonas rubra]MDD1039145.1 hypothetical protein [Pseudomonas rubra]MDD1157971.1 hypothetical protein [Pseudomonas rubra]
MDREVPAKYIKQQKFFKRKELLWSMTHYGLGVSAGVLAFLAASPATLGTSTASTLAMLSGAVAAVLTFLSPASRRKAYTEARDLMRIARMRFEEEDNRAATPLIDAMEAASQVTRRR